MEWKLLNIKRFIDRVSALENQNSRDLVIPIHEARVLRDEIAKLVIDLLDKKQSVASTTPTQIEIRGGKW